MLAGFDHEAGESDEEGRPRLHPTLALLRHLGAQANLYRIMAKDRGLGVFLSAPQDEITAALTDHLTADVDRAVTPAVPPALLAAMITGMLVTVIRT